MYIGSETVKETTEEGGWVSVVFENGRIARYPKEMYDAMLTVDPSDDTSLRDRRILKVMQDVVSTFIKYDLTFPEIMSLSRYVENYLEEKKAYATAHILRPHMKNPMAESMHPSRTIEALTIGDVDAILEHGKTQNNTGSKQ